MENFDGGASKCSWPVPASFIRDRKARFDSILLAVGELLWQSRLGLFQAGNDGGDPIGKLGLDFGTLSFCVAPPETSNHFSWLLPLQPNGDRPMENRVWQAIADSRNGLCGKSREVFIGDIRPLADTAGRDPAGIEPRVENSPQGFRVVLFSAESCIGFIQQQGWSNL